MTSASIQQVYSVFRTSPESARNAGRSEEHTSELQSRLHLVCRLLLEKKKDNDMKYPDLSPSRRVFARCSFPDFVSSFFFFNDTATTEIYTLSLHDALPISYRSRLKRRPAFRALSGLVLNDLCVYPTGVFGLQDEPGECPKCG